mgnify:CR=1 FL=1
MPLFSNPVLKSVSDGHYFQHGNGRVPKNLGDSKWQKLLQKWLPTCAPLPAWA